MNLLPSRTSRPKPSVAIIGAGFGGMATAIELKKHGFERVTIFEKSSGFGGTWWNNTYPGAAVDTPSILYSYSFVPWRWSATHVDQAELQAYIAFVADHFDLVRHARFETKIDRVEWEDSLQQYRLFSGDAELATADFVVSAVGLLSDPRFPAWAEPGRPHPYRGVICHSALWDHTIDLRGSKVAVVGSGSTAAQLVPALAESAASVTLFQRDPGWVVPKRGRPYTDEEREALGDPVAQRLTRWRLVLKRDKARHRGAVYRPGTKQHAAAERIARNFIEASLGDRPDLVEAVTPTYPYGGKRPIISDDFYPSLKRPNVTLVTRAVVGLTERGVVDAAGDQHEFDAVVLATGFKADFLTTMEVTGRDGIELHKAWGGDESAFLGMMVPGFPNFFIMYGPNTNGGSILTNLELQASYIRSAVKWTHRRGRTSVEVRERAFRLWDDFVQRRLAGTAFNYENNYYRSGSGRIATQWADASLLYGVLTKLLRGPAWETERRVRAVPWVGTGHAQGRIARSRDDLSGTDR